MLNLEEMSYPLTFKAHFSFSLHEGWRRNVLDGRSDG